MEQPTRSDYVLAWRRYAGDLRQRLGAANARIEAEVERVIGERERADVYRRWLRSSRTAQRRAERRLSRIDDLLREGDVLGARRLLEVYNGAPGSVSAR